MNNDIVTLLRGHNIETEARPRRGIKTLRPRQHFCCLEAASRHTSLPPGVLLTSLMHYRKLIVNVEFHCSSLIILFWNYLAHIICIYIYIVREREWDRERERERERRVKPWVILSIEFNVFSIWPFVCHHDSEFAWPFSNLKWQNCAIV